MSSDNPCDEESASTLELQEGTPPYEILRFLAENDEQVHTSAEIHEATGIEQGNVDAVLPRLEKRGFVRQEEQCWTIGDDDRLASCTAQVTASSVAITDDYYDEE